MENNNMVPKLAGGVLKSTPGSTIDFIKDKDKTVYPITVLDAIYDNNGKSLKKFLTDTYQVKGSYALSNHTHPAQTTITGNAGSATKLQTARYIFGGMFDGTANVTGKLRCYGKYMSDPGLRYSNSGIEITANDDTYDTSKKGDIGYAPSIGFHWPGVRACSLQMSSDGILHYFLQDGVSQGIIAANIEGYASYLKSARGITIHGQKLHFNGANDIVFTPQLMKLAAEYNSSYVTDLNQLVNSGAHRLGVVDNIANSPGSFANYGQMLVLHGPGDTIAQMAFSFSQPIVKFRVGNPPEAGGAGQWYAWNELIDRTRFNPCKISSGAPEGDVLWAW